eukprot:CAMPEP_0180275134 /NCGR_PEP_ID=MMETSP0988-20121125/5687_1 /TAXON_ID=697907 /ORGANISM="non described non described, Strain CCMP2293" /LENGTH=121 /DNA_ID=CAMNT_0022246393 /DNA_START=3 /DNA_END=365 /DNA_ORIENTATION=-
MIKELKARFDSPEEAFAFFDDHKSGKISRTQIQVALVTLRIYSVAADELWPSERDCTSVEYMEAAEFVARFYWTFKPKKTKGAPDSPGRRQGGGSLSPPRHGLGHQGGSSPPRHGQLSPAR